MPESLLWINKDSGSAVLSRSSKAETRQIRKHVQHERQLRAKAAHEAAAKSTPATEQDKTPYRTNRKDQSGPEQTPVDLRQPDLRLDTNVQVQSPQYRPSLFSASLSPSIRSPTTHSNRVLQAVNTFPGLEPQELRSLVFFCQRTAPEWSGWRDATFWNKLILQACHMNRSILHGVVALGALHESSEVDGESDERSNLQELALHQSSKASRMAYETAMSDIATLISCVIFICLQNLQDSHTAYQLLKSGYSLITDIDERLRSGDLTLCDSEKTVLNNFLRPIVERLRMRFCSIVDLPSALALSAGIKRSKIEHRMTLPDIPYCFGNLLEARNKLEEIVDWAQENIDPSFAHSEQRSQVQALLASWNAALEDTRITALERYEALNTSKKLLRAAALVASILCDTLGTSEECSYDHHVDKFAEVVNLYRDAIGDPARAPRRTSFGIDSGVIDTLAFVAGRCRDPVIRRSAIDLLAQTNRTEGDLQGCTGSTILQTLMELEEDGADATEACHVPESQRLRIWEDHQYWDTGKIHIFFVKWPYDPSLGAEMKTASVYLPLKSLRTAKEKAAPGSPTGLPNVKYGRGVGAFLEEGTQTYHQITLSSFFMPVPRL
ncbi:uncharacterized protein Z520_10045 [Fonsecaea multimorphosa CBS 102226]|uniref:Uncharacterized protein n=1 Tax=Fonsecaea multimorphosa CBS 102226 TaxID=1442371 RepID=A0A0D2GXR3_9EURO|nr:uncharacterized protein Z520_10045 [Fonsecaea multimorphosa CBS 102226]KIX94335.1 hypothetical protein Z520_10045 [Fonsecaea multimorphosa CBS 102226]OAL19669.1 hypothetical protein AYO22_09541 [Fonsecaea multimorphosa]